MGTFKPYIEKSACAFDIDPTTLDPLIGNSGAEVFKGAFKTGSKVLRIISPKLVKRIGSKQRTLERLLYKEGLAAQLTGDVAFAGPVRSESGELGQDIETDGELRIATAYTFAQGKEVSHRINGLQIQIDDPEVGGLLYERIGRAAGMMHQYSSEYPIWWSAADSDRSDTPFSHREDRDGAGLANGTYHWVEYVNKGISDAPEILEHWQATLAELTKMTAERDEYGFVHFDYSLGNMLYNHECLTIIDHNAFFGHFVSDCGSPFTQPEINDLEKDLRQTYWLRFVTGYRQEFPMNETSIPWLNATIDFRRIVFYLMNIKFQKDGRESYDFAVLDRWREDMITGRPWVDIDFFLP